MIFYFTGTGNSKYIADKLAACLDDKTIDIAKSLNNNTFTYDCSEENYIGFVFPTYGMSVPSVVKDFVVNMELDNIPDEAYIFTINNNGGKAGSSLYDFDKLLLNKNINLDYARSVGFPDNYILSFDPLPKDEQNKLIRKANIKLANVINNILRGKKSVNANFSPKVLIYKLINFLFVKLFSGTSKFRVKENCVGCQLCSKICNCDAIEIQEGKPVWVKSSCVHCLACINRCPVQAIEYGNGTEGRDRYVNPLVQFDENVDLSEYIQETDEEATETENETPLNEVADNEMPEENMQEMDSVFYSDDKDIEKILESVEHDESYDNIDTPVADIEDSVFSDLDDDLDNN